MNDVNASKTMYSSGTDNLKFTSENRFNLPPSDFNFMTLPMSRALTASAPNIFGLYGSMENQNQEVYDPSNILTRMFSPQTASGPKLVNTIDWEKEQRNMLLSICGKSNDQQLDETINRQSQQEFYGWGIIKLSNPNYHATFLSCNLCRKTPHCNCNKENCCIKICPNFDRFRKNTCKGHQRSHCPVCLQIRNGKFAGISFHNFSDTIEVYICGCCAEFYQHWTKRNELVAKIKCDSKFGEKGRCLNKWSCK